MLNVVLAAAGSLLLALVAVAASAPALGVAVAVAAFGLALAAIYLRGYLVPGTPTLTERHLPDRVLSALGAAHEPDVADGWEDGAEDGADAGDASADAGDASGDAGEDSDEDGDDADDGVEFETLAKVERERREGIEPAAFLREVGAAVEVEPSEVDGSATEADANATDADTNATDADASVPDADDLRLTAEFEERLQAALDRLDPEPDDLAAVGALFDAAADDVAPRDRDYPAFKVDARIRKWPSAAALRLDLAADEALADRSDRWPDVPVRHRDQTRELVRSLVERCPDCGGELRESERVVESCCRSGTVVGVDCTDCGARVHEYAT